MHKHVCWNDTQQATIWRQQVTHAGALAQYAVATEESFLLLQVESHVVVGVPGRVHGPDRIMYLS